MSEKKKLGRGLAEVMDVFFPSREDIPVEKKEVTVSPVTQTGKPALTLKDNIYPAAEQSYLLEKNVSDILSLKLNPYEDVIYNKLYRLSFGEGKNYCQIGYGGIIESTSLKCTRTAKISIDHLIEKKYIARINIDDKDRKGKGTLYRVFTASEIMSGKTLEGFDFSLIDGRAIDGIRE
ncbi:MAG: hypothetical protein ABRQ39_12245 [Candidatus Eremiobacterota bacterium]